MFKKQVSIEVINGEFSIYLIPDAIYTLSTVSTATKGQHPTPIASKPLTLPFYDNFDLYKEHMEVRDFVPQVGSFETIKSSDKSKGIINRQTVLQKPILWSDAGDKPITMGSHDSSFS